MTTENAAHPSAKIEVFRHQMRTASYALQTNLAGISHEESLIQPRPAGNCLNWVVGHLLTVHAAALRLLGQQSVIDESSIEHYERGEKPLTDASAALPLEQLLEAWKLASRRIDDGLTEFDPARLSDPAPFSPGDDPDETVGSLLSVLCFHQAYHAGQAGLLRRLIGKEGAIA